MKKIVSIPKILFFTFIIAIVFHAMAFLAGVHMSQSSSSYASAAMDESQIQYISVPIVANDTLSGIAKEYYSDEFGSMQSYIARIKEYNSLTSDNIYAGNYLIIPVYQYPDPL